MCQVLDRWVNQEIKNLMIFAPSQHGKALGDNTIIATAYGWKRHGNLKVGDIVYDPSGRHVKVLAVSEPCECDFEVEFSDGSILVAHSNHEWDVYDRRIKGEACYETALMTDRLLAKSGRPNLMVSNHAALDGIYAELPMPPYSLGAWLGDGTSNAPSICHANGENEVVEGIEDDGFPLKNKWRSKTGAWMAYFGSEMIACLKNANVWINKHIPRAYMRAPVYKRMELLAGLVDTDGSYNGISGQYRFINTNKILINDVRELATSLGFRVGLQKYKPSVSSSGISGTKTVYVLAWTATSTIPCRLARKRATARLKKVKRSVVAIRKKDVAETGRCIQVDGGKYLAGKELIPTHNSELVSRRLPAYALGKFPDEPIIATSYSSTLAAAMNRDVQRVIDSDLYRDVFPETKLFGRMSRSISGQAYLRNTDEFEIVDKRGYYRSAGLEGGITGRPARRLICDDPYRDRADASSAATRKHVRDWFFSTFRTRRTDEDAGMLVTMTRWEEDDLAGTLIDLMSKSKEADQWEVVLFPALKEDDSDPEDPRQIGDALWEENFSKKYMEGTRATIPARDWSSMYRQKPQPASGSVYQRDWFREFVWNDKEFILSTMRGPVEVPVEDCRFFQTVDTAMKAADYNDYTVVMTFALTKRSDLLVFDVFRARLEVPFQYRALVELGVGPCIWMPKEMKIVNFAKWPKPLMFTAIESQQSGIGLLQQGRLEGVAFKVLQAKGSKVERSVAVVNMYNLGRVYHLAGAAWRGTLEDEMLSFPTGKWKDQCLVAGTMVETAGGSKPIESVTVGDLVATRKGWRKVAESRMTDPSADVVTVEFSDGSVLTGTANHPVLIEKCGFVPLDVLSYGDIVDSWAKNRLNALRQKFSMDICTEGIRNQSGGICEFTSGQTLLPKLLEKKRCIEKNGRRALGRFLKDLGSTTKTAILKITNLATSNACMFQIIESVTGICGLTPLQKQLSILRRFALSLLNGIDPKLAWLGISRTSNQELSLGLRLGNVLSVAEHSDRSIAILSCAPLPAISKGDATRSETIAREFAPGADRHLLQIGTEKQDHAVYVVRGPYAAGKAAVYNLKVDGEPEFYANGNLVHNCDTLSYGGILASTDQLLRAGHVFDPIMAQTAAGMYTFNQEQPDFKVYTSFGDEVPVNFED